MCQNVKNVSSFTLFNESYVSTCRPRGQDFRFPIAFPECPTQYGPIVTPCVILLFMFPRCHDPFDTCHCMFQIILNTCPLTRQITKTHKVKRCRLLMNIHSQRPCRVQLVQQHSSFPKHNLLRCIRTAALVIVKEVANHANDIMKQGVSDEHTTHGYACLHSGLLICTLFFHQDNFQKLIQVQCSLNGHHEIVQPGRVRSRTIYPYLVLWQPLSDLM